MGGDTRAQLLAWVRVIWRRRWFAIAVAWVVCVFGWLGVLALPDRFEAKTRVYVDTQTLLAPLLQGITVQSDLIQQVTVMKQTLMSRPNLAQVIRMTDLDLTVKDEFEMERLQTEIRDDVSIQSEGRNLFTISFESMDPKLSQRVVQSLLSIFVENNLGQNRTEMESARTFLEGQLSQYERQLREADQRLAEFRAANLELLSGAGSFVQRAEAARLTLREARAARDDAIATRDRIQQQLESIPQLIEVDTGPTLVVNNGKPVSPLAGLESRIYEIEKNLDMMLSRYTDRHPDVVAAKRTLDMLKEQHQTEKAKLEAAPSDDSDSGTIGTTKRRMPNQLYEQVRLRLVEAETEIAQRTRRVEQAESDVARFEALAKTAPAIEAKLTDMQRDNAVLKKNYEELLSRRESAKIAQAVDAETDIQFRVVDPPEVPTVPTGPNRPLFMSVVLMIGLGAGVAVAFLLVQLDDTLSTPAALRQAFNLPVLGVVTTVITHARPGRRLAELAGFCIAFVFLLGVYGGLLVTKPKLPVEAVQARLERLL